MNDCFSDGYWRDAQTGHGPASWYDPGDIKPLRLAARCVEHVPKKLIALLSRTRSEPLNLSASFSITQFYAQASALAFASVKNKVRRSPGVGQGGSLPMETTWFPALPAVGQSGPDRPASWRDRGGGPRSRAFHGVWHRGQFARPFGTRFARGAYSAPAPQLTAALARNVYDGHGNPERLARYVEAASQALANASLAAFMTGPVPFPRPSAIR